MNVKDGGRGCMDPLSYIYALCIAEVQLYNAQSTMYYVRTYMNAIYVVEDAMLEQQKRLNYRFDYA